MKSFLYFVFIIACILSVVSGIWYWQSGATVLEQVEYVKVNFLDVLGEKVSNTSSSASKLGNVLKGQLEEAQDVYHNGAEAKYE
ncbi:MAG: hypothetical protein IKW58_03735 [Alphaproteobacteria bacterium]|nr:hypothetical protein [Alphaproteobacteria bacterium]